jgi:hypothetical protein
MDVYSLKVIAAILGTVGCVVFGLLCWLAWCPFFKSFPRSRTYIHQLKENRDALSRTNSQLDQQTAKLQLLLSRIESTREAAHEVEDRVAQLRAEIDFMLNPGISYHSIPNIDSTFEVFTLELAPTGVMMREDIVPQLSRADSIGLRLLNSHYV